MCRKLGLIAGFVFSLITLVFSQPVIEDLPQITGCIALINAKVVTAPGKSPVVSTIVMRDGLITDIGSQIKIPADAFRIQADSLYAFPAFIDAFSYTGVKNPENEANRNTQQGPGNRGTRLPIDAEGNPSLEDAGITPMRSVRSSFDIKEKSIADWRGQGFAIAHVVPRGKMIPGMGSVIVLAGKDTDQMFWKEDVSMFAQWSGAGEMYPATVIGIMAKWRELYHNATQDLAHQTSYNNATLVSRPVYNEAHDALIPVVKQEMPVYFRAPKVKDISRALSLHDNLGMKMVISDAEEAWYLMDQLKKGSVPLVLSLDLPEDKNEAKETKEGKGEKEEKIDSTQSADTTKVIQKDSVKVDPEKAAFEKRRTESLKAHYAQASVLARAGIPFSFGTLSGKSSDFYKNIKLMMDNGLSADTALSALTTQPAKLLGIEKKCGTIEVGKMANVIVSNKPIFEKDAAIKYMIVEGNLYEYEVKEKKKNTSKESTSPPALIEGTWSYTIDAPDQKREGTFEFEHHDGEITGIIESTEITSGNKELESIVIDGNTVSFTFDFDAGGQMIVLEFNLNLNGETFEGNVEVGEYGTFPVSGQRISKPKN